jgi:peptidyl-prolyl cis-trans isomerase C
LILLCLGTGWSACDTGKPAAVGAAPPADNVVALLSGRPITVEELEEQINRQETFIRTRYTAPERKKEFLDSLVRLELLAAEAERRGYTNDPDIIRMYKQQLVARLVQKDLDPKFDPANIPEDEVRGHYDAHLAEFVEPEAARGRVIVLRDEALAKKVAGMARKLAREDEDGFTKLVEGFSEDANSRKGGGDTDFVKRGGPFPPAPVLEALFGAHQPGEILGPIKTDKAFAVVRFTGKRAPFTRTLEEAAPMIRRRLAKEKRGKAMEEWVAKLRDEARVEIFEDKLSAVKVDMTAPEPQRPPVQRVMPDLAPGIAKPPGIPMESQHKQKGERAP